MQTDAQLYFRKIKQGEKTKTFVGGCPRCLSLPGQMHTGGLLMFLCSLPQSSYINPAPKERAPTSHIYSYARSRASPRREHELPRVTSVPKSASQQLFSSSWLLQQPLFLSPKPTEQIAGGNPERSEDCLQTDPNTCDVFAI